MFNSPHLQSLSYPTYSWYRTVTEGSGKRKVCKQNHHLEEEFVASHKKVTGSCQKRQGPGSPSLAQYSECCSVYTVWYATDISVTLESSGLQCCFESVCKDAKLLLNQRVQQSTPCFSAKLLTQKHPVFMLYKQAHKANPFSSADILVAKLPVIVGAVSLDVYTTDSVSQFKALVVLAMRGLASAPARCLQQRVIRNSWSFKKQDI